MIGQCWAVGEKAQPGSRDSAAVVASKLADVVAGELAHAINDVKAWSDGGEHGVPVA